MGGDVAGGLVKLPEGEGAAQDDGGPDDDEDRCGVLGREVVPEAEDVAAVVDAEPSGDRVACGAADGEGGHEGLLRHLECACGEDEGRERHGWREDGGEGYGEDCVALHPVTDAVEDARGDAFFEEGYAAGLADLIAEVSADCRAQCGDRDQEKPVIVAGG